MDWQDSERFPLANGDWQFQRPPFGRIHDGEVAVTKATRSWHPFDPVIVATPSSLRFAPPICLPETAKRVHATALRHSKFVLFVNFVWMGLLLFLLMAKLGDAEKLRSLLAAFVCFQLYFFVDDYLVLRHKDRVRERALFVHFVYQKTTGVLLPLLSIATIAGIVQVLAQKMSGDLETLLRAYGLVFTSAMEMGQYWRFLIGPFFHSGIIHWFNNIIMLMLVAGVAGAIGKRSIILHFFAYIILTSIAVYFVPTSIRAEALVGISGAIFGLHGWIFGVSFRNKPRFPQYFYVLIGMFFLLSLVLTILLAPKASNTAHISGFVMGALVGFFNVGLQHQFRAKLG